ncbi:MAG TPA: hypothetical protein VGU20_02890 [Stellaceae bacterium]|nr:hypothetical protein [Stellaceae bacterium]
MSGNPQNDTVGPLSPRWRVRKLDGRTREAKRLRQIEADLVAHLGGPERVNAAQRLLIERVSVDLLRLAMFDTKTAAGQLSDLDSRIMHALRNSTRLTLRDLGAIGALAPEEPPPQTALDYLREKAAKKAAAP